MFFPHQGGLSCLSAPKEIGLLLWDIGKDIFRGKTFLMVWSSSCLDEFSETAFTGSHSLCLWSQSLSCPAGIKRGVWQDVLRHQFLNTWCLPSDVCNSALVTSRLQKADQLGARSKGCFRQNLEATSTNWLLVLSEPDTRDTCTLLWCLTHTLLGTMLTLSMGDSICLHPTWAPTSALQASHAHCAAPACPACHPTFAGQLVTTTLMCSPAAHRSGPRAGRLGGGSWLAAHWLSLLCSHPIVEAEQEQSMGCPLHSSTLTETLHSLELQSMISIRVVG